MSWVYSQTTGNLDWYKKYIGKGYSGTGPGRNNPLMQSARNIGPIPQGRYDIGPPHDTPTHGPYVMNLTPLPETMIFHRSGFLIHGDNRRHDASHGCIILAPQLRHQVWHSGDRRIRVVP